MARGETAADLSSGEDQAGLRRTLLPRLGPTAKSAVDFLLDVMLPPLCLNCNSRLMVHDCLCPACWRQIDFIRAPQCDRLGIPLPYDTGGPQLSAAAVADPPDFDRARMVARYSGPMRQMVHSLKFHDRLDARRLFARWLAEAGVDLIRDADVVAAVPLARGRLIWRRFNQSQMLANELGRIACKPVAPLALTRIRATRSQIGLSRSERRKNVAGAFRVTASGKSSIAGKKILLVDDVITTGATVNAAARALRQAGAVKVDVLALALAGDVPAIP